MNAISLTKHRRKDPLEPTSPGAAEWGTPVPTSQAVDAAPPARAASAAPTGPTDRADADPWTVPQSVRDRFVQVGQRYFFPDGAPAFKDQGTRLTTPSENTQVVASLIEIAHSRGWTEVTVSGTERFRQEAWRQARITGLEVRGYRPTDIEQAQLIRAIAHKLGMPASPRVDEISADVRASQARAPAGAPEAAPLPPTALAAGTPAPDAPRERIVGRLLDHGRDAYRHDPQEEMSYFVRVETPDGKREIWGKDLERAMNKSLTQPQLGDEVVLQKTGRDLVTVKRAERDGDGELKPKEVDTYRNRWVIEQRAFFEGRAQAAQLVRDATIDPRTAVSQHPELAGTYLNLKAAELAAQRLRDPEDRERFVAQVRRVLADDIERGEPLQPVRLRERAAPTVSRGAREADRGLAR
jgi:putative DNA primase/helicase